MIVVLASIMVLYIVLIAAFTLGMRRLPSFEPLTRNFSHSFSILVVFRDEKDNLPILVKHLKQLDYPKDKFEVILVDDGSVDGSKDLVKSFQRNLPQLKMRLYELKEPTSSPKKDALEMGVKEAAFDWIITTDADCVFGADFLNAYDQFLDLHPAKMVAGPVIYEIDDSFLHRFQALDFLSLQGSTMGGFGGKDFIPFLHPFMCNGANICYEKKAFLELGGYEGNKEIASGDDVFLLEKMLVSHKNEVHFIKSRSALVQTLPEESWKGLAEQRKRWAAKSVSYTNVFAKTVGTLVLLANFALILGLGMAFSGSMPWSYFGILFVMKINVDFLLIYNTASLWGQEQVMKSFVMSSVLYPFFVVWIVLESLGGSYTWKGRNFRK
jgi:cellulose synthase/poly-beta-1,6-N-acetylglucosamine synthase-like glycosyltransferase